MSERSGIASIGVDVSAHQPQPARPRYRTTTMNRFFSAMSISRLIMLPSPNATVSSLPRAHAREPARPDQQSGQTHDDCEWLDEEDGEQNVLRHGRDGHRRRGAPSVTQHESREIG